MKKGMYAAEALVIIPTYNEKENIGLLIQEILTLTSNFHLLIVDDASPDGTGTIVTELQKTHPQRIYLISRKGKLGIGSAYITGFKFALKQDYQYILTMDADFSHAPQDLIRLYTTCKQTKYDLVIGSRYISGVNVVNWPIGRVLLSYFANTFVRFITGMKVRDATAGLVCYHQKILATLALAVIQSTSYSFQVEIKFLAYQHGFAIKELPIVFTNRVRGSSKMSKSIIFEAFWRIIKAKINSFRL